MSNPNNNINLREIIREEYKRCLIDPIYFMKKYVKIQHPLRGTISFDLYEFQEKSLTDLIKYDYNIILKSRQMGITTLTSAYALWLMIFHKDKNILCISIKQETAKEIVTRVRFANNNLPSWLKVKCTEDNRLSLRLENGSQIKAVSSSGDAGRSSALSLLIIDEAAFIDSIEEIWLSAQQTLSTGGKAIILSTPNGVGNFFHKTWVSSEEGQSKFNTINLPWHLHPERNQEWRDEQTKLLGIRGAAQECDCDFSTTGHTVLDVEILKIYKNKGFKDPLEKRWQEQSFWIWKYPDYNCNYLICADVARGDGGDKSAFHVLNLESLEQVAEYKGCVDTKTYGNLLVSAAQEYNNAILVVENNNVGWATLQQIIDLQYPNTFYSSNDLQYIDLQRTISNKINKEERDLKPGFTTTTKTRPLIISKLESYFREQSVIINSIRLYEELSVFIWNGSKAEAMTGYNDDLVTSLGMGLWVRDTSLRLKSESALYNKSLISSISKTSADPVYLSDGTHAAQEYWKMHTISRGVTTSPFDKNVEDLRWLL
jgi:hypothetical protein